VGSPRNALCRGLRSGAFVAWVGGELSALGRLNHDPLSVEESKSWLFRPLVSRVSALSAILTLLCIIFGACALDRELPVGWVHARIVELYLDM